MTGRGIDQVLPHPCAPTLFETWVRDAREYVRLAERANGAIPWPVPAAYPRGEALAEMDRRADALRVVNLETAIASAGTPWPRKGIHYRMHPANLDRSARVRHRHRGAARRRVPPALGLKLSRTPSTTKGRSGPAATRRSA
jgi:poly-gamma-glutamate capsule biosynthesis protein CapA/YwtB (metallophosphatase superfamily)